MPDAHDELCEKADVGSLCDCHCAGAKHAIRHTKGGVPGAGAVSKAAQKAAHDAGRAPVVNNKAQPKEGSRIAPGAPKTFKEAAAGGGKGGKVRDTFPYEKGYNRPDPKDPTGRAHAETMKTFDGTGAEMVHEFNTKEGDTVTHRTKGVGTVTRVGKAGQAFRVKYADGKESPEFPHNLVKGDHAAALGNGGGGKPAVTAKAPISLMSDLNRYSDAELRTRHAEIEAKIKPQGGISGPQRDIQQRIERELARRDKAAPAAPSGGGKVRDTFPYEKGYNRPDPKDPTGRAHAETMKTFDGTGAEMAHEFNTKEGDTVTHRTKGVGTIMKVGKAGQAFRVKYADGTEAPEFPHNLVKGDHGDKVPTGRGAGAPGGGTGGADGTMTVSSRKRGGDATTEKIDMRLTHSAGRRARVDELKPMSREQFDALPAGQQQQVLADLRHIARSNDTRSARDRLGISYKTDQNHIGNAKGLLSRFTVKKAEPSPDKGTAAARYAKLTDVREIDGFLKGLDRAELAQLGESKGWLQPGEAAKYKPFYLRKVLARKASDDINKRGKQR